LLEEKKSAGITTGFMFRQKDGKVVKSTNFEESLIERLEWIQQNTEGIIPKMVNLWEEFGVRRSTRRGAAMEALNAGLGGPTIGMPRYYMRQRYTQVLYDLRHQLLFSLGI
jgi:hypothetical protein